MNWLTKFVEDPNVRIVLILALVAAVSWEFKVMADMQNQIHDLHVDLVQVVGQIERNQQKVEWMLENRKGGY